MIVLKDFKLFVFETEKNWFLFQSQRDDDKFSIFDHEIWRNGCDLIDWDVLVGRFISQIHGSPLRG